MKKHTSILYNNMWVFIYYVASIWALQLYKEKKTTWNEKKRVGRIAPCCHPPFSHLYSCKKKNDKKSC